MMQKVKCRILFIAISLTTGGAEKHIISLINNLDEEYFELHLCYLKDVTTLLPQIKQDKLNGLFCGNVTKKVDFKVAQLLANYIDEKKIDIILNTDTYPMLYAVLAKFLSKSKPNLIEVFHATDMPNWREKLKILFYKHFWLFQLQEKIVYVSKNQCDLWRSHKLSSPSKDLVIHNGINTTNFTDTYTLEEKLAIRKSYGFYENDYLIGICAVLRPEKAHYDLLQAIKNLHSVGVLAKCLIIGDGVERSKIEQQIVELGLQHDVKITGYQQDVRCYIASCDVMTIVSHAVETFSISALESMSLGKPVVMSDIGGANEIIENGKNGYLFPVGDIKALENALIQLYDKETRLAFGQDARERVLAYFTQEKMIAKFQDLFFELQSLR